jgi:hypothetical protein
MASNTIYLKGKGQFKEGNAGGTITPGHLLTRNTTADQVVVHATAEGNAYPLFALENDVVGKGIDTNYTSSERVLFVHAQPGDEIFALVDATVAIVIGDELVSTGDGTLKKVTAGAVAVGNLRRVVAIALEAKASGSGRLKVETV